MDPTIVVAGIGAVSAIAASLIAVAANRRTERIKEAAEATKGQVDIARLQLEQWQALLTSCHGDIARLTEERDRYRDALHQLEDWRRDRPAR